MAEPAAIRERLRSRLAQLAERTGRIESDLRRPGDSDWPERATQRANDEVLERLDDAELVEMEQIRAALARLDAGRYGRCQSCDGEIEPARLETLPHAPTCIDCAGATRSAPPPTRSRRD